MEADDDLDWTRHELRGDRRGEIPEFIRRVFGALAFRNRGTRMISRRLSVDELRIHADGLRRLARRLTVSSLERCTGELQPDERRSQRVLSPDELTRRAELQRVVADELLALPEPYREAVLFYYFGERRPGYRDASIAQERCGIELLRGRLREREHLDRMHWLAELDALAKG